MMQIKEVFMRAHGTYAVRDMARMLRSIDVVRTCTPSGPSLMCPAYHRTWRGSVLWAGLRWGDLSARVPKWDAKVRPVPCAAVPSFTFQLRGSIIVLLVSAWPPGLTVAPVGRYGLELTRDDVLLVWGRFSHGPDGEMRRVDLEAVRCRAWLHGCMAPWL